MAISDNKPKFDRHGKSNYPKSEERRVVELGGKTAEIKIKNIGSMEASKKATRRLY
ncbi:MAG: hypothetical protein ACM3UW_00570 [Bacillota bacterium]